MSTGEHQSSYYKERLYPFLDFIEVYQNTCQDAPSIDLLDIVWKDFLSVLLVPTSNITTGPTETYHRIDSKS